MSGDKQIREPNNKNEFTCSICTGAKQASVRASQVCFEGTCVLFECTPPPRVCVFTCFPAPCVYVCVCVGPPRLLGVSGSCPSSLLSGPSGFCGWLLLPLLFLPCSPSFRPVLFHRSSPVVSNPLMRGRPTAALVKRFARAYFTTLMITFGLNSSDL